MRSRGEGVKKSENFADVINGRQGPMQPFIIKFLFRCSSCSNRVLVQIVCVMPYLYGRMDSPSAWIPTLTQRAKPNLAKGYTV